MFWVPTWLFSDTSFSPQDENSPVRYQKDPTTMVWHIKIFLIKLPIIWQKWFLNKKGFKKILNGKLIYLIFFDTFRPGSQGKCPKVVMWVLKIQEINLSRIFVKQKFGKICLEKNLLGKSDFLGIQMAVATKKSL